MDIRICFLGGTRFDRPLDVTTAKKFRQLRALAELFVIGFSQDLRPRRFTENAHFYLLPKLPLPILRYVQIFLLGPCLAVWLIVRHGVHILVAQSPYEGFAATLAKCIAGWLGYKVALVVESHGDFEESVFWQRRVMLPMLYRRLMRRAAQFALKKADCLRSISAFTRQQLERRAPGKPIVQFPTWTDIDVFRQAGNQAREATEQIILYTGVLIPRKGVHHLVNAFAHVAKDFPQVRLVIVGDAENAAYAAELQEQVRQLGLSGRVQFIGVLPQVELASWMRKAWTFVLPSLSEGLGRVVIEAMAAGTPVIGSRVGGIMEMVEDGSTGFLIPPGDEVGLADKLCWLLDHPEEARIMGCRARAFAERFYSAETYINGYRQVVHVAQQSLGRGVDDHAPSPLQPCDRC
jgi:glycosyltransferase involved in cell wall biosynthesis